MAQYLKPDSQLGYIEDNIEIENLKINNLRHVILGCMLGDFNENGAYVVSPEILKELIEMDKYVVQTYENIEICKSCLKLDRQISFMVTFEGNRATLTLLEKLNYEANFAINSGAYSNINEYVLDVVETSGEVNRNAIYLRWNIKTAPTQMIDIFNCGEEILEKYFGIVKRFKYLLGANKILLQLEEEIEEIEAEYANDIINILSHYPKLKEVVVKTINEALEQKKDMISVEKPYFAKTFNELLENAIEKNIDVLSEEQKEEFSKEKRAAMLQANVKKTNLIPIEQVDESGKEESPSVVVIRLPKEIEVVDLPSVAGEYVAEVNRVAKRLESDDQIQHTGKTNSHQVRGQDLIGRLTKRVSVGHGGEHDQKIDNAHSGSQRNKLIANLESMGVPRTRIGAKERVAGANNTSTPAAQTPSSTQKTKSGTVSSSKSAKPASKPVSKPASKPASKSSSPKKETKAPAKPAQTKQDKGSPTTNAPTGPIIRRIFPDNGGGVRGEVSSQKVDGSLLQNLARARDAIVARSTTAENKILVEDAFAKLFDPNAVIQTENSKTLTTAKTIETVETKTAVVPKPMESGDPHVEIDDLSV